MKSFWGRLPWLIRPWSKFRAPRSKLAVGLIAALATAAGASVLGSLLFLANLRDGLPDPDALARIGDMNQATAIFDVRDSLAFTVYKEQRIDIPLDAVSPHVVRAIVAIEDQQFFEHRGFNPFRIGVAALTNLRHGRLAQGGSTITQQLARLSFLTPDKTLRRKLQELILARRIEHRFTKDQILALYLNKVYFGDGLYGIEAASRGYFGKPAKDLTVPEAALLAGLVKSPSSYAPTVQLKRAVARRNVVLKMMYDSGAINRDSWQAARDSVVALHDTLRSEEPVGLYFKEQVRQELVARFGWERVYEGGLRVFSTIDMNMQRSAETAVAAGLKSIEGRRATMAARRQPAVPQEDAEKAPLQAALLAMEPATGHVLAMVGGRNFDDSHFNRAVQAKRQPGSAFKPFVYAAALEAGYSPATVIQNLNAPIPTLQGAWTPEDGHSDEDSLNLRTALRISSNRAAVRLLQDVGIGRTVEYAKAMGVGNLPSVPSLALGSGDVTLQSLTAAYAAFANHGDVPRPMLIRRVEDRDGNILYQGEEATTHAISATTAFLMADMLADVINAGTGARARSLGFALPAAGKTGTTNDYNDAWFVGFTPSLVAGVWVGFDQPHTILPNGFAADVAVPVWAGFMKSATDGNKPAWLSPPPGIVSARVCRLSGKLATEGCDGDAYVERFASGTEPDEYCDIHTAHGSVAAIASVFSEGEKPTAIHVETAAPAPVPDAVADRSERPRASDQDEPQKKKRGFWSRVLGIGKGNQQ